MVHIRECMRRWLPFVIMAASLGVSPAQDVASPDAADLDLDLVKLKSGPKGRQREAMPECCARQEEHPEPQIIPT